jgi:presenilin-like A22 family membrane protease
MKKNNEMKITALPASSKIIILFLISQLIALFVGIFLIINFSFFKELTITEEPSATEYPFYLLLAILVGAVVLMLVLRLPIRSFIIRVIEFFASVFASYIVFFVFLASFSVPYADIISLCISLSLYFLKFYFPRINNLLAIVSAVGVGAVIGFSLDPLPVIILLFLVSLYDIVAVWFTGHMVEFAKFFAKERTVFTISEAGLGEVEKVVKGKKRIVKKVISMMLGAGDIALPASLVVSSFKLGDIVFPLFVIVGAVFGLYLVLKRAERERKVYPAMPSISAFSIFAFLFVITIYYLMGWL